MTIGWLTAFIDGPRAGAEPFWPAVTGTTLSARRGDHEQFATLLPPVGDAFVRTQRIEAGSLGVHVDLHVDDRDETVRRAVDLGATEVGRPSGVPILHSPAGAVFCVVGHTGEDVRPGPLPWPGGLSLLDQVCLDVGPDDLDREVAFWTALTGWPAQHREGSEFTRVASPAELPLRLLVQELGAARSASWHLDFAASDMHAEARRHIDLGATLVRETAGWITLADPDGMTYCVTGRDPETGSR